MINRYFNPCKNESLKNIITQFNSAKGREANYRELENIVNDIFLNKELRFFMKPFNLGKRYYDEQYERNIQNLLIEKEIVTEKEYLINSISYFKNEVSRLENIDNSDIEEFNSILNLKFSVLDVSSEKKIKGFIDEYNYILKYLNAKLLRIEPTYSEKKLEEFTTEDRFHILSKFNFKTLITNEGYTDTQANEIISILLNVSTKSIRNYNKRIKEEGKKSNDKITKLLDEIKKTPSVNK